MLLRWKVKHGYVCCVKRHIRDIQDEYEGGWWNSEFVSAPCKQLRGTLAYISDACAFL